MVHKICKGYQKTSLLDSFNGSQLSSKVILSGSREENGFTLEMESATEKFMLITWDKCNGNWNR